MADHAGIKKKMLAGFLVLGVAATASHVLRRTAATGCWRAVLFVLANIGVDASIVFYESLLPAHRQRGRGGPRLHRRLRARLPGRRPAHGRQPARRSSARSGSASPTPACRHARVLPERGRSGGSSSPSPCSGASPSRRAAPEPATPRGQARSRVALHAGSARRCASCAATARPSCSWSRSSSTTTASSTIIRMASPYGTEIGISAGRAHRRPARGAVRRASRSRSSSAGWPSGIGAEAVDLHRPRRLPRRSRCSATT